MYQIPYFRKEMAITISGLKTGPFRHLEYDQVAQLPKESSTFHLKVNLWLILKVAEYKLLITLESQKDKEFFRKVALMPYTIQAILASD